MEVSLQDLVGSRASTWLEESRHPSSATTNSAAAHDDGNNTFGTSLFHVTIYVALLTLLVVWARKHYHRHNHHRQRRPAEQVEEVIFVLGIPLLIPRTSSRSRDTENDDAVGEDGHA